MNYNIVDKAENENIYKAATYIYKLPFDLYETYLRIQKVCSFDGASTDLSLGLEARLHDFEIQNSVEARPKLVSTKDNRDWASKMFVRKPSTIYRNTLFPITVLSIQSFHFY